MKFETKTQALMTLAQAYETKNTNITDKVEAILLPKNITLNDVFKEKIESIGSNPIEEPLLYALIETNDTVAFEDELFKKIGLNSDDFNALDVTEFMVKAHDRIVNLADDDGVYKATEKTMNAKLPKTKQINELLQFARDGKDDLEFSNKVTEKIFEMAGIKEDDLSEWEKNLIVKIYQEFISSFNNSLVYKVAIDKTPFGGYLKN